MTLIPTIIDKTPQGERAYDIYSRLLEDRIIFVSEPITDALSTTVIAQLLYLEKKDPDKDIIMYVNSPG
jgi:ATP-dependent Clp protease, protease subunit